MKKTSIYFFFLLLGIGIGVSGMLISRQLEAQTTARQVRQGGYALINPLLECEVGGKLLTEQMTSFRHRVEEEVQNMIASGQAETVSVYFRNLNNGLSFGINEQEEFSPASLLKLPILIAYYKESEDDPTIFARKVKFTENFNLNAKMNIPPEDPIEFGKEYTIEDLLYRMIVHSDNDAMALLVQALPLSIQDRVYKDLGITIPGVRGIGDYMTVKEYSSFFRILYNASYLSEETSQKALELLLEVDYADGVRAGVPRGVQVANKFGERAMGNERQLHDCGIIYYNDHPYLLCVMSRGTDFTKLSMTIKDISQLIYSEVDRQVREE